MIDRTDILIVGAGPVGLYLGCLLAERSISFVIVDSRTERTRHSRSIGIHPPALEMMKGIGIADELIAAGVRVSGGVAFGSRRRLGRLSFDSCPPPYRFVLSLPQHETETILENRLEYLTPGRIRRNMVFQGFSEDESGIRSKIVSGSTGQTIESKFLVGCDGVSSTVRTVAGIAWNGGAYPDTYVMGDFADNTSFGTDAAIFLHRDGLVESFPLPDGLRRWVVKTASHQSGPTVEDLVECVHSRTRLRPDAESNTMLSAFGVQHRIASTFAKGRIFLAGDAAHIISPIGGQGMNLGWMDARELASRLDMIIGTGKKDSVATNETLTTQAAAYTSTGHRAAAIAMRRASFNMRLGRHHSWVLPRNLLVGLILHTPLVSFFAHRFSMRRVSE